MNAASVVQGDAQLGGLDISEDSNSTSGWSLISPEVLQRILDYLPYADVYFCALVCRKWQAIVKNYFSSLRKLYAYRMVHRLPPRTADRVSHVDIRICSSCMHVGLHRAVAAKELDMQFGHLGALVPDEAWLETISMRCVDDKYDLLICEESNRRIVPYIKKCFSHVTYTSK